MNIKVFSIYKKHILKQSVLYVHLFSKWINTSLFPPDLDVKYFFSAEKPTKQFYSKPELVLFDLISLLKLIITKKSIFFNVKTVYLNGLHYSFLIFFKFFSGSNYKIVIANFYIHGLSKKKWFNDFLRFLFKNKNYIIISQSTSEVDYFKSLGNQLIVHYVPYCMERLDIQKLAISEDRHNYIFSGGYSNRDYSLLIKVASCLPHINFVIVVSNLNNIDSIPPNVTLHREIASIEFNNLMYNSFAVILPLKDSTGSSGQMVALAAMQMRKCVIYTNYPVISQYFDDQSGVSVTGNSVNEAIDALNRIWLNYELVEKIGNAAYNRYDANYSIERYNNNVLKILLS